MVFHAPNYEFDIEKQVNPRGRPSEPKGESISTIRHESHVASIEFVPPSLWSGVSQPPLLERRGI